MNVPRIDENRIDSRCNTRLQTQFKGIMCVCVCVGCNGHGLIITTRKDKNACSSALINASWNPTIKLNIQTASRFWVGRHQKLVDTFVGSVSHSFTFSFCCCCSCVPFVYIRSIAKTTLRFKRTYNIPFAGVYWFICLSNLRNVLYTPFYLSLLSSKAHTLFTCKRGSYTVLFNLLRFLSNIALSFAMFHQRQVFGFTPHS